MNLDAKSIGLIITFLTSFGGGAYHLIDSKNKAEVELNLNKKYEKILTDNIRYKFVCGCDSI